MKKRIVLLANHMPGLEVCKYLLSLPNIDVVAIFTSGEDLDYDLQILKLIENRSIRHYKGKEIWNSSHIVDVLGPLEADFLISVYWPWLIKKFALNLFKDSVNFHPALLPRNRGWYPHVYNIKDNTESGISLHRITQEADAGDIWAFQEVPQKKTDTASDLYLRLQIEIVELFKKTWPRISEGSISPTAQEESNATYNSKHEIAKFDELDLDAIVTVRSLIDLLRARTFNGKGYAYYIENGTKISISISLTESAKD